MRQLSLFLIASVLLATVSFADEKHATYNFRDIKLGDGKDHVIGLLKKYYPAQHNLDPLKVGANVVWAQAIQVDTIVGDIDFFFDHKGRLYKYEISSTGYERHQLETGLPKSAERINGLFTKRFSPPIRCQAPPAKDIVEMLDGRELINCVWEPPGHNVYTAYRTYDAKFFTFGSVSDKGLEHDYVEYILLKKEKDGGKGNAASQ